MIGFASKIMSQVEKHANMNEDTTNNAAEHCNTSTDMQNTMNLNPQPVWSSSRLF